VVSSSPFTSSADSKSFEALVAAFAVAMDVATTPTAPTQVKIVGDSRLINLTDLKYSLCIADAFSICIGSFAGKFEENQYWV
jgi:hypothetical protein